VWYENTRKDYPPHIFYQSYPSTAEEAFTQSVRRAFPEEFLVLRAARLSPVDLMQIPPEYRVDAKLKIYQHPRPDRRYCAGIDVAEGANPKGGGDRSVVTVIDYESNEEVAFLAGRWDVFKLSDMVNALARYFPGVWAVERNGLGLACCLKLQELGTPGLYREEKLLTKPGEVSLPGKIGWTTTSNNKALMIAELEENLRMGYHRVATQEFLDEARVFEDLGDGRYSAPSRFLDDTIMSRAIAIQMRKYMSRHSYNGPRVIHAAFRH
jgi:hypothetical protein